MVALLVVFMILLFLTVDYLVQRRRSRHAERNGSVAPVPESAFAVPFETPSGVFFTPAHSWMFIEPDGVSLMGVTEFAWSVLGSIDRVEARKAGESVRKGDVLFRLHHKGRAIDFRAPVGGVVEEVNDGFLERRGRRDGSCLSPWLYKFRPEDPAEIARTMMIGESATRWIRREIERLKTFLATLNPENGIVGQTAQDGGTPVAGLVDELSDQNWGKFLEKFFAGAADEHRTNLETR